MIILGVDPGYDRLGVAVLKKDRGNPELLYSNSLSSKKADPFSERLLSLSLPFEELLKKWKPECCAMENIFLSKNQKTVMRVSEVRGMLLYLLAKYRIPSFELSPSQIKVAITGYGRAEKSQLMRLLPRLISIPEKKRFDDEYDAIAIALACPKPSSIIIHNKF